MSTTPRKNRKSFRPSLGGVTLEDRVVMSGATVQVAMLRPAGVPAPTPVGTGAVAVRQLQTAYRQQFQATQAALKQYVNEQVATLYDPSNLGADGRPTRQALADFSNNVSGALNATTLGLSSQASLLPGSGRRLVGDIQQSLLGNRSNSLASQIARQVNSGRAIASQSLLQATLDRQISSALSSSSAQVSNYLQTQPLNRLSVDQATGRRVPLSQFLGNQAAQQINNTFGTLANSVGPNASSMLFDSTGTFNAQAVNAFQQQYGNALNTAAYQVNSILSVLPNSSSLRSQLQSSFFGTGGGAGAGTGTGSTDLNLFNALSGVFPTDMGSTSTPFTADAFSTAFQNGFTTAFQNFSGSLNTFLNAGSTGLNGQLPTGFFQSGSTFPSIFGPQFTSSSFNNGFNNGFVSNGTGFPGFGTFPTGFNTAFGTGFNNLITNVNGLAGVTVPTIPGLGTIVTGTGTGIGTIGTGTGTGTGVTDPSTGLGGVTDPSTGLGGVIDPSTGLGGATDPSTGLGGTGTTGTGGVSFT